MNWRRFFERQRRDEEFAHELEAHLTHEIDELVARGVPPDEARAAAARKLGNRTSLREVAYERNSLLSLEALLRDVRYGLRQLRRSPLFTGVAVLSLALGIGANTAMFSLLDQSFWRPLPVREPSQLVWLYQPGPLDGYVNSDESDSSFSYPLLRGLRESQTPFVGVAGARSTTLRVDRGGRTASVRVHRVSGNYFDLLGVRPALGRLLSDGDDRIPGAHAVVVLSHIYWQRDHGGDPSVIGRTLVLDDVPLTVVGVAPRGFFGENRSGWPELYVPLSMSDTLEPDEKRYDDRKRHWVKLMARLKPGMTLSHAAAEVQPAYRAELEKDLAGTSLGADDQQPYRAKRLVLRPGGRGRGAGDSMRDTQARMRLLPGMTLLVLAIACANIANLQLSRATTRGRELCVRVALGASRIAIVRQLLVESVLLAAGGAAAGLVLAWWLVPVLSLHVAATPVGPLSTGLDVRVLLFTAAMAGATAVACGLYPAWSSSRPDVVAALKAQSLRSSATASARLFRFGLVTGLSLLLVVLAGLLTRTLFNLTGSDLGFETSNLVTFRIEPGRAYDRHQGAALVERIAERMAAIPGVARVSMAAEPVVAGVSSGGSLAIEGYTPAAGEKMSVRYNHVGPGFFGTLGLPLVAGRDFGPADDPRAPRIAIVNETFVRRYYGGGNALGRRVSRRTGEHARFDIEIVGVARDAKYHELREATTPPFLYQSFSQERVPRAQFYLRTAVDPASILPMVTREIAGIDPQLPVRRLKTMTRQIEDNAAGERGVMLLAACFGGVATLLAGLGLYGVLAYNVSCRVREIGIRIALGAAARDVRALLLRDGMVLFTIGTLIGLAAAAGSGRLVQAMLFEVTPWDPGTYVAAVIVLGAVVAASTALPARRAARIDPVVALRHD